MYLRFGTRGVNMAQVTDWAWEQHSIYPNGVYKLYLPVVIDGTPAYVALEGEDADAFEQWLRDSAVDMSAPLRQPN